MAYTWDAQLRQYRLDGELVSDEELESWLDKMLLLLALSWIQRSKKYFTKEISFADFYTETNNEIVSMHRAMTAIAFGGVNQTRDFDFNRLEEKINEQTQFFYAFAVQIFNETVSPAQTESRLTMYALAGFATFSAAVTHRETDAGMLIYRRVLDPKAEHCEDCIEYAFRRWQFIGTLPAIGQSQCRVRCRCRFEYSRDLSLLRTTEVNHGKKSAIRSRYIKAGAIFNWRNSSRHLAQAAPRRFESRPRSLRLRTVRSSKPGYHLDRNR